MKKMELVGLNLFIYKEVLENGLEVYLIPYENRNNYYATYLTKFGSINIDFKVNNKLKSVPAGIAHFLEHKMFEQEDGTDPFNFFTKNGTNCNASTSYKRTRYFISGNRNLEGDLKFFIDFINSPYYTDENVEKEKGIIIEELKMYKNMPSWKIGNELYRSTFKKHPIRIDIGGTEKSVKEITKEQLYDCYNAFYQPSNMILVVAGNFDCNRILEIIKENEILKKRTNKEKIELKKINEPLEVNNTIKEISIPSLRVQKLAFSIKSTLNKKYEENKYKFRSYISMLLNILFGPSSEFKEDLMNKGIMTTLNVETLYLDNLMILEFNSDTSRPDELIKYIDEHIKNYKIKDSEFQRLKKVWISSSIYAADVVSETASLIASYVSEYNSIITDALSEIKSMNLSELEEARKAINIDNKAIIIAKPVKSENQQ